MKNNSWHPKKQTSDTAAAEIEPFKIDPKLLEALERALGNEPDPDIPMSDI